VGDPRAGDGGNDAQVRTSAVSPGNGGGAILPPAPSLRGVAETTAVAVMDLAPGDRPRERLSVHGAGALSAAELIGVLWGSGTRGHSAVSAAADALRRHEGLVGLARATDSELREVGGVGPVRAAQLAAAFELGRRVVSDWPQGQWVIHSPRDVGERLVPQMGYLEREELRVVLMNARNAVQRLVTVYQGNVSSSLVRIGELFRDAVRMNAAGVILVHNHPSGDATGRVESLVEIRCTTAPNRTIAPS
jgi:DNA repair protein RadC